MNPKTVEAWMEKNGITPGVSASHGRWNMDHIRYLLWNKFYKKVPLHSRVRSRTVRRLMKDTPNWIDTTPCYRCNSRGWHRNGGLCPWCEGDLQADGIELVYRLSRRHKGYGCFEKWKEEHK